MTPETVEKAIDLVRSSWPQQNLTERAEESWRYVFRDCADSGVARTTLDELAAYRKGRPASGEFAELYRAKVRPGNVAATVNTEPLPERDPSIVSEHVQRCKRIAIAKGAKYRSTRGGVMPTEPAGGRDA